MNVTNVTNDNNSPEITVSNKKHKNFRGYSFSLYMTVFGKRVELDIHPFAWNRLMLCLPRENTSSDSWHLNFGCFHLWGMSGSGLFEVGVDVGYLVYWWEKPVCPPSKYEVNLYGVRLLWYLLVALCGIGLLSYALLDFLIKTLS